MYARAAPPFVAMTGVASLVVLAVCACAHAQYAEERAPRYIASTNENKPAPTPVPILKQINKHNEDGSYTYGYEGADGSFKIETKAANGEVKGKYGYKDDTGKLRVIEYGANKYGFQPAGDGITVAPPTLVDETANDRPGKTQSNRNQQPVDYDYEELAPRPAPRPAARPPQPQQQYRPAPQPQQQYRPAPQPQQQYRPAPQPQQQYRPAPQQQYRPAQQSAPTPPKPQFFAGAAPAPASQDSFFRPEPAPKQQPRPKAQDFRPAPQFQQYKPAIEYQDYQEPSQDRFAPESQTRFSPQQFAPQQQFQQPRSNQQFSMLDQLLKEFALPQNGAAATHDITFGSY